MPNRVISTWTTYSRERALAVLTALEMWSNRRYAGFVISKNPAKIEKEWFEWFIGEWRVGRTIKSDKHDEIRMYLNKQFRLAIANGKGAGAVDSAERHIVKHRWTSRTRNDGTASGARSLVAKVGFFLCPSKLVPFDTYALIGLNALRGSRKEGGEGHVKPETYMAYLEAYNQNFRAYRLLLEQDLKKPWVAGVAKRLGCQSKWFRTRRFQRKTFDNFLVHVGKRVDSKSKSEKPGSD